MPGPVIHRFWMGGEPPMEPWLGDVVRMTNPTSPLRDLRDIVAVPYDIPDTLLSDDARQLGRHTANVVRWNLLYEHGGIYLDHDVIPLRALPEGRWVAAHGTPCNCAISLPEPHDPAADLALDTIYSAKPHELSTHASGEVLLAALMATLPQVSLMFDSAGRVLDPTSPIVHAWHRVGS